MRSCVGSRRRARDEVRYATEGPQRAQDDGVRGEIAEVATEHLLELHQSCWTYRRLRGGVLRGASRIDRLCVGLSAAAFGAFAASCAVGGGLLCRSFPSDHLPVLARITQARRLDDRIRPGIDRRVLHVLRDLGTPLSGRGLWGCR